MARTKRHPNCKAMTFRRKRVSDLVAMLVEGGRKVRTRPQVVPRFHADLRSSRAMPWLIVSLVTALYQFVCYLSFGCGETTTKTEQNISEFWALARLSRCSTYSATGGLACIGVCHHGGTTPERTEEAAAVGGTPRVVHKRCYRHPLPGRHLRPHLSLEMVA